MHSIYGQEGAENLFLNTGAELLFGGADQRLAEEVSKRGGSDTVRAVTTARPRFLGWLFPAKQHEHSAERARSLLLPQEVQRLPRDEMIVLRPTLPPLKLSRIVWYTDPWFRRMSGDPPEVPRLQIAVERDPEPALPAPDVLAAAAREAEAAQAEEVRARIRAARDLVAETAGVERRTAEEARQAVAQAAIAAEQARHARAEATDAHRAARTATDDAARLRLDVATTEAKRLSAAAADVAEVARVAKAAATAATRAASAAEKRAQRIVRAAEESGIVVCAKGEPS
jgi:hypothetical protein